MRRWRPAVWGVGFLAATVVTVWSHELQWQANPILAVAYSLIGVGWLCTAWLLFKQEDQTGNAWMFLAASLVWIVGETARRDVPVLYPIALFVSLYSQILCSSLLLRYPRSTFDRSVKTYLIIGCVLLSVLAVPLVLTAPGPSVSGDAPGRLIDSIGPYRFGDFESVKFILWMGFSATFFVLLVARWRRLAAFERRTLAPILISGVVAAATIGAGILDDVLPEPAAWGLGLLRGLAGVGVTVAFVVSAIQLRVARGSVADLAGRLSGPVSLDAVREALVAVLDDPTIAVLPCTPETGPKLESTDVIALPVPGGDGRPRAVAIFNPDMRRHTDLLVSHLAVCGLALENAALTEDLRAQLHAVEDARARIVHAGSAERRRLERDLHDGAQQRLLALGVRIGALEANAPDADTADALGAVRGELHVALEELRDLAHGIYPSVLMQAGLGPALEEVIERQEVPFSLTVPSRRWDPDIESAAYFVACEAITNVVKHAGPCRARVDVVEDPDQLVLRVADTGRGFTTDDAVPFRLRTVEDRLTALGGSVEVDSEPGAGTRITARLPLP